MIPHIYLTFDDGPSEKTVEIARLLHQNNVQATFFMSGNNIKRFPTVPKQVSQLGHTIGVHGMSHANPTTLGAMEASIEISQAINLITSTTGVRPTLYRAPYGNLTKPLLRILKREKLAHIDWDRDTLDWKSAMKGESLDVSRLLRLASNGSVMLFHDGAADTRQRSSEGRRGLNLLSALPVMITELKRRGYEFRPIRRRIELRHNVRYVARSFLKHFRAGFKQGERKPTVFQAQLRKTLTENKRR